MPSARVFVHPRCWDGPALGLLSAYLEADRKWDTTSLKIGPLMTHRRRELVHETGIEGTSTTYQRLDGTTFTHRVGLPVPEPESA
ncbi:MAG: hypothetical protein DDT20_00856 [Firmicutes bacterium]|nr:hypothetical protein [Bacillota bacterium]